jgi:hypothetical protein
MKNKIRMLFYLINLPEPLSTPHLMCKLCFDGFHQLASPRPLYSPEKSLSIVPHKVARARRPVQVGTHQQSVLSDPKLYLSSSQS